MEGPWGPYDPSPGAYGADDPGGGPYNPATGIRKWYNTDTPDTADEGAASVKWADILQHWLTIQLDLHEVFGVDTESGILTERTWWWLHDRIIALINKPTRLRAALDIPATATA